MNISIVLSSLSRAFNYLINNSLNLALISLSLCRWENQDLRNCDWKLHLSREVPVFSVTKSVTFLLLPCILSSHSGQWFQFKGWSSLESRIMSLFDDEGHSKRKPLWKVCHFFMLWLCGGQCLLIPDGLFSSQSVPINVQGLHRYLEAAWHLDQEQSFQRL